MIYVTLVNLGDQVEIVVGGNRITIKQGDNWMMRGTAEFITSKVPNTKIVGKAVECNDEGTSIDEIQQGIKHKVTEEEINENNLDIVVKPNEEIIIPIDISPTTIPVTPEDKTKYEEELKTMKREQLVEILKFKEVVVPKNLGVEKLIKLILKSL